MLLYTYISKSIGQRKTIYTLIQGITNKASTHLECFLTAPVARGDELLAPYVHPHSMEFTQDGDMNRFWWLHYGFTFKHEEDSKENSVHNLRLELEVQPLSD